MSGSPRSPSAREWTCARITLEGVLSLGRGLPEGTGLAHPGYDSARPVARGVDVTKRFLGHVPLIARRTKVFRSVAVVKADEILVEVGSVDREEPLEQLTMPPLSLNQCTNIGYLKVLS